MKQRGRWLIFIHGYLLVGPTEIEPHGTSYAGTPSRPYSRPRIRTMLPTRTSNLARSPGFEPGSSVFQTDAFTRSARSRCLCVSTGMAQVNLVPFTAFRNSCAEVTVQTGSPVWLFSSCLRMYRMNIIALSSGRNSASPQSSTSTVKRKPSDVM